MVLPIPSGRFRVGVIEADVPCPSSAVGVVPVVIYYPCLAELEGAPREELPWLAPAYAGALGSVLFSRLVGAYCADVLMSAVGPAGTDYAMARRAARWLQKKKKTLKTRTRVCARVRVRVRACVSTNEERAAP